MGLGNDLEPKVIPAVIAHRMYEEKKDAENDANILNNNQNQSDVNMNVSAQHDPKGTDIAVSTPPREVEDDRRRKRRHTGDDTRQEAEISRRTSQGKSNKGMGITSEFIEKLQNECKEQLRAAKLRTNPAAVQQVLSYNASAEIPQTIPDHNDPYPTEWTNVSDLPQYVVGERALHLNTPSQGTVKYKLTYPLEHNAFAAYSSTLHLMHDLYCIWKHGVNMFAEAKPERVVLILPDLVPKGYRKLYIQLVFQLGFTAVQVVPLSVAATYGAGMSSAVVVDIGSTTKITCVDEGVPLDITRIELKLGAIDVEEVFSRAISQRTFPYKEIAGPQQWNVNLRQHLVEKTATLVEEDVLPRVHDFYVRAPRQKTQKFSFKTFEENFISPLILFYPEGYDFTWKTPNLNEATRALEYEAEEGVVVEWDRGVVYDKGQLAIDDPPVEKEQELDTLLSKSDPISGRNFRDVADLLDYAEKEYMVIDDDGYYTLQQGRNVERYQTKIGWKTNYIEMLKGI